MERSCWWAARHARDTRKRDENCGRRCKSRREAQPAQPRPLPPTHTHTLTPTPTQDAVRTFAWALDHLYRPGDTVHLLHVVPAPARTFTPPSGAIGYIPPPPPSAAADLEAAATAFLAARLYPEATARGLDPGAMVRPGVVHEATGSSRRSSSTEAVAFTILKAADEIGASNLVMVSHHKARLHEALWGSVSKTVAAQARIPVTLVH